MTDYEAPTFEGRIEVLLERIAIALEQGVLERIEQKAVAAERGAQIVAGLRGDPYPSDLPFPTDEVVDLPPVVPQNVRDECPIHHQPWKTVPAGKSKRTGNEYGAFRACSVAGCDQRPRL